MGDRVDSINNNDNNKRGKRSLEDLNEYGLQTNHSLMDSLVHPNFEELSRHFPSLGRAYQDVKEQSSHRPFASCITQDFSIELTKALLRVHWGISLSDLPSHHLCPPVPNRYFLIHWLRESLLPCLTSSSHFTHCRAQSYTGLDIGTGATCIYPLLFIASSPSHERSKWKIWASDVDEEAIALANANVRSNQLQTSIQPFLVPSSQNQVVHHDQQQSPPFGTRDSVIPADEPVGPFRQSLETMSSLQASSNTFALDFCLTNPPFYDSADECTQPRQGDGRERTSMTLNEGQYPCGEVGFCLDILLDQCILFSHNSKTTTSVLNLIPGWTAIMCGKKTSFVALYNMTTQLLGFSHVCTAEFGPGNLTRWFLAWSWQPRPSSRSPLALAENWQFAVEEETSNQELAERLCQFARDFSLQAKHSFTESTHRVSFWQNNPGVDIIGQWSEGDNHMPMSLLSAVRQIPRSIRRELLPNEGHYYVVASVHLLTVQVRAYIHTPFGKQAIARLKQQMPGEINRSNRKWRRIRNRQRQQFQ